MNDLLNWIYQVFGDFTSSLVIQGMSLVELTIVSLIVLHKRMFRKNKLISITLCILFYIAYIYFSALLRYSLKDTGYWIQITTLFLSFIYVYVLEFILFKENPETMLFDMISIMTVNALGGRVYSLFLNCFGVDEKAYITFITDIPDWAAYLIYWAMHIAIYSCFIPMFHVRRQPINSKKMRRGAIIFSLISVLVLELSLAFSRNYDGLSIISCINKGLCIMLCTAILVIQRYFYYRNKTYEEQLVIEEMLKEEQIQFENLRSSLSVINSKLHDLRHQIEDFQDRITQDELARFQSAVTSYDSLFDTGNRVLDIILYEKKTICIDKGINFSSLADGSVVGHIDNTSLYALLSNAINNAIEASLIIEKEDRFIGVNIYQKLGIGYIEVTNRFDGVVNKDKEGHLLTRKKDDKQIHGLGYTSMKYIAEKYNGYIFYNIEEYIYTLTIVLPLP